MFESVSPITIALYSGGLQLLLRQWKHFHEYFQHNVAMMPTANRIAYIGLFEQLLMIAQATAVPVPARATWKLTETLLQQWIVRYRSTIQQLNPAIGDFTSDRNRIQSAIDKMLHAAFLGSLN